MNGRWKIVKAISILFAIIFCIVLIYLVVDLGGDSKDILSVYNVVDGSKSEFPKQLQFMKEYIRVTGDITIALNTGMSPEEIEQIMNEDDPDWDNNDDDTNQTPTSDHNHVYYSQGNYNDVLGYTASGTVKTISTSGCGFVSLTVAMAELDSGTFGSYTPSDWATKLPQAIKDLWASGSGMSWAAPGQWIQWVNNNYSKNFSVTEYSGNCSSMCEKIAQNAGDSNKVVLVSCDSGLFTGGGHIICVTDLLEDNGSTYMHISDSSGVAARALGKDYADMASYSFPLKTSSGYVTSHNSKNYSFKRVWIINKG